ncbi:hypothetical protein [Streptomyces thioluteus]|uniref:hypothetical protein n=1 Tax=Streptomyces thioluteus TaxID=66431 RepID=UPI0031E9EAC4
MHIATTHGDDPPPSPAAGGRRPPKLVSRPYVPLDVRAAAVPAPRPRPRRLVADRDVRHG